MRLCAVLALAVSLTARSAFGQSTDVRPRPVVEFLAGYAGFVDDTTVDHGIIGAAARVYLTPRLALGPECVHMRGPDSDRDLFLTGNLTFDVLAPLHGHARRVTPFLVAGGGFFRHTDRFGASDFSSYEGAFTAGGGIRAWMADRVYGFADVRFGWEPHLRMNGGIGIRW